MSEAEAALKKEFESIRPPTYTYKTYSIPKTSPDLSFLVGKYAALSQRALTTNPESFGVAYSTEASWTSADYTKRVTRPNANVFVCVAHPSDLPEHEQSIEKGAWIGTITMIGPTPKAVYWVSESGAPEPLNDESSTNWHQTGTWIDPAHRGKGIARMLIGAAIIFAIEYSQEKGGIKQVRMRAYTGPDNEKSKGLYGGCGFPIVGNCTIAEAMVGNGNTAFPFLGRTDWSYELLNSRAGVLMEKVVEVLGVRSEV